MEGSSGQPSRRRFLSKALAAAALLKVSKVSAEPALARSDPERERLARLLEEYGSELGNLRRVEGKE